MALNFRRCNLIMHAHVHHDVCDISLSSSSEVLSERSAREKVVELHVIQRVQVPPFPSKCAMCSRSGEDLMSKEGKKILRCSKCKAVGYCSR